MSRCTETISKKLHYNETVKYQQAMRTALKIPQNIHMKMYIKSKDTLTCSSFYLKDRQIRISDSHLIILECHFKC